MMERRKFLQTTSVGLAAAATASLGAPAVAQSLPAVRWRLASSFPKSLDTIYGAGEFLTNRVSGLTEGKFEIRPFAAGEIVPGLQVLDACQQGTVECGHTASYYYVGKNKAFAFDTALPFGVTARQQNAWLYYGGGMGLLRNFFKEYNIINFPGGNTGAQMGGWFRKEITSLTDLKGLKMRIAGLGGEIMARLGAVPQQIAGGEIYPALEKGTIDAVEWVGPYDDEKLSFYKVAPYYYYPGWWEGSAGLSFYVNISEWQKLPRLYQEAFEVAAAEANLLMLAAYDAKNPAAMARLVREGTKLRAFPKEMMEAAFKVSTELYEEEAGKNPSFKTIYEPWKKFRLEEFQWFRVAEASYANFMYTQKL
jgi:TRAP-type mannitol/chloroaromatic compound transport system substrate-binding protein